MQDTPRVRQGSRWTKEMQGPYSDEQMKALVEKWGFRKRWEEYQSLEISFSTLASDLPKGLTAMAKMKVRDICEWRLVRDAALAAGDTNSAKRLSDMINGEEAKLSRLRENNTAKLDGLVARLEARGMMSAGKLLLDKVIAYITNDAAHYSMSRDAADQCILLICNTILSNEGMETLPQLPDDKKLMDVLGEFEPKLTEEERKALETFGYFLPSPGEDESKEAPEGEA